MKSKCLSHFYLIFGSWLEERMLDMLSLLPLQLVLEMTSLCFYQLRPPSVHWGGVPWEWGEDRAAVCTLQETAGTRGCSPRERGDAQVTLGPQRPAVCSTGVGQSVLVTGHPSERVARCGQKTGPVQATLWGH